MAQKLFVGGLSYNTTSDSLREFFSQCGEVASANVVTDQFSGRSRGFGFIEMSTAEEANQAAAQLNGRELDGRALKVEVAKPKAPSRDGGRSGSFGGGHRGGSRW
jgi:RNA recognition motif-containing protein